MSHPNSPPAAKPPKGHRQTAPRRAHGLAICLALAAVPAAAATPAPVTLDLPPAATRAALDVDAWGSYAVPTAPWTPAGLATLPAEGTVTQEAWQLASPATTLQLLAPLRDQLAGQGYELIFECESAGCGGFDFRYETLVLPEPEMHVDLTDFRFLAARRPGAAADYVTLLVSRTSSTGYVQVTRVGPGLPAAPAVELSTKSPALAPAAAAIPATAPAAPPGLVAELEASGRAVLDDLSFATGATDLAPGRFASLDALAAYLSAHPDRRVTLVGHTDAAGSLTANIALSRARARAVMLRLTDGYGVAANQVEADGVGYLMPLASNLTDEGRTSNRRVEAVLTSAQ